MLQLPKSPVDTLKLADWLELTALLVADKQSSAADLTAALRLASIFPDETALENMVLEVYHELEHRAQAAGKAYPFKIEGNTVTLCCKRKKCRPYVFCLCLSYFGFSNKKPRKHYPERLFEDLSCDAATHYLNGRGIRFGWPRRRPFPAQFISAVDCLCKLHVREGEGFRPQPSVDDIKDDRVDIVAWKEFPDNHAGKLLLFGACAAGTHWEEKRLELRPDEFCKNWMINDPPSPLIKAFFVPHRVQQTDWDRYTRDGGIIFDRCRISLWSTGRESLTFDKQGADKWIESALQGVAI
jgi:hypothetical protein